jgi:polar amino acid transport system substrate-binding protein
MSVCWAKVTCYSACLLFSLQATRPLADTTVLEVGVQGIDQLPIALGDPHSRHYEGFARELLDDFAAHHGHQLHYHPLPILRLYDKFLYKQTLHLKFPDNPNWRTDLRGTLPIVYSQPLLRVNEGLAVLPQRLGRPLEEIRTIGSVRGFTPVPYLEAILSQRLQLLETSNMSALIALALSERVDAIYVNQTVLRYHLGQQGQPDSLLFDRNLPHLEVDFHISTLKAPDIIDQLNRYLNSEHRSLARLRAKYGIDDQTDQGSIHPSRAPGFTP